MHVNFFAEMLAFAPPPSQSGGPAPTATQSLMGSPVIFLVLMAVMMYFVLFRPQQQQRKQQAKMLAALKTGDRVVTSSGIVGVVTGIREKEGTVSLRSADAKLEVTKASITQVLPAGTTES